MPTYASVGWCIYCNTRNIPAGSARFGDEHIIALALGGNLVLPEACCESCAKIINREIETPVSRWEWGHFRSKHALPTRNKKRRKTHIKLRRTDGSTLRIPVKDYSAPVFLYKFGEARILTGLGPGADHLRWSADILTNHKDEVEMRKKYPEWDGVHRLKAQPHEFARLLAKIAYGYAIAELGMGSFHPLVIDIILGRSDNYFYTVGGSWEIAPAIPGGNHITKISLKFIGPQRALVIVDIRLFSAIATPSYHVIVGEIDLSNAEHFHIFEKHRSAGKFETVAKSSARLTPMLETGPAF